MDIKIKSNIKSEVKILSDFVKNLSKKIDRQSDLAMNQIASELKTKMVDYVKSAKELDSGIKSDVLSVVRKYNFHKYEKDIIKGLFGEDLAKIVLSKDNIAYNTFGTNSNIHVMKSGFLRSYREISPDDTLQNTLSNFTRSLNSGLILDADTGEIFLLGEELSENFYDTGAKMFCTTSRGVNPFSEADFNKYKTGKRKVSGFPGGKIVVPLTIKKADLDKHLRKAIPLGTIQDLIMEGKYDEAKGLLSRAGQQRFKTAIDNIDKMKESSEDLPEDTKNLSKIINTIRDVKVKKFTKKEKVDYKLVASLEEDTLSPTSRDLYDKIYPVLMAYVPDMEKSLVLHIVKAIDEAIKELRKVSK
jgi:hypothetical protein